MKFMKKILNTLKSIDLTLKRIELKLSADECHNVIYSSITDALLGKKKHSIPED